MVSLSERSDAENEADLQEWLQGRPQIIRDISARLKPWKLYRMKSTGHRVTLYSIYEDGTLSVDITGDLNLISMERRVFGIDPDDLEECDRPGPDEPVGVYLNQAEQLLMINRKRADNGLPPFESLEQARDT